MICRMEATASRASAACVCQAGKRRLCCKGAALNFGNPIYGKGPPTVEAVALIALARDAGVCD